MIHLGELLTPSCVDLGQLRMTPQAQQAFLIAGIEPYDLLARHASGDWGNVDPDDWAANNAAVQDDERILSVYVLDAADTRRVWIITDADRSMTTLMTPEDY